MTSPHILYGQPPHGLVDVPLGAQQYSPLIPGSAALEDLAPESLAGAVLYAPPGTIERRAVFAAALKALAVGTPLTALAPNDKGGTRIARELEAFGCTVANSSRKHHRIVNTTRPANLHGIEEALSDGGQQQHPAHGLFTQPGVFNWDAIDEGSTLLMNHLPAMRGAGADLGCGIGILSSAVLESPSVSALTLVDIDRRAVSIAKKNIADPRAHFVWADVRSAQTLPTDLDFIVMNPPFHDAGVEDKSLGQQFIIRAAAMLRQAGALWLVANRHLPYEELLASHFATSQLVAQANGFKVFRAEKA